MAAAAVDAADTVPLNLGRQDVRIPPAQQGIAAGRGRVRNDSEWSVASITREKAVQTLDHRLAKVEQNCQKTEDALRIMRNQAVIDQKEINDNFANLFNKLSPLFGTAQTSGVQNLGVASSTSYGTVPTQVIPARQGWPVDHRYSRTTEPLRVDLVGVQPTGLHPTSAGADTTHTDQLNTGRAIANGEKSRSP